MTPAVVESLRSWVVATSKWAITPRTVAVIRLARSASKSRSRVRPDPVVVEHFGVTDREAEHTGVVGARPLTECVERAVSHHEVAHHLLDHRCRGQPQPGVAVR